MDKNLTPEQKEKTFQLDKEYAEELYRQGKSIQYIEEILSYNWNEKEIKQIIDSIKDISIPIKENLVNPMPSQTNFIKEILDSISGIILLIGLLAFLFIPILIISGASYIFNFFIEKTSGFFRVIIWGMFYCFVCFILALFSRKRRGESFEKVFIQMLLYPFGVIIFIIIGILTFL
jgi:hypothetical protein